MNIRYRTTVGTAVLSLVATTGGSESDGALHLAAMLAARGKTTVLALGVAHPFPHATAGLLSLKGFSRQVPAFTVGRLRESVDPSLAA